MPRQTNAQKLDRARQILGQLKHLYPEARCALDHHNALELLIATILSAQCTDVRVNMVTPALFEKYPTARALADAPQADIEKIIQSTGFFRSKAKAIKLATKDIVEKFGGKVPDTMEELTSLHGVGRKTANVVLGNAFGKNVGIVVDTHVTRLAARLGLTTQTDPVKIEQDLMKLVPQSQWALWAHLLIFHGRQICWARNPQCHACKISGLCPSAFKDQTKEVIA